MADQAFKTKYQDTASFDSEEKRTRLSFDPTYVCCAAQATAAGRLRPPPPPWCACVCVCGCCVLFAALTVHLRLRVATQPSPPVLVVQLGQSKGCRCVHVCRILHA